MHAWLLHVNAFLDMLTGVYIPCCGGEDLPTQLLSNV